LDRPLEKTSPGDIVRKLSGHSAALSKALKPRKRSASAGVHSVRCILTHPAYWVGRCPVCAAHIQLGDLPVNEARAAARKRHAPISRCRFHGHPELAPLSLGGGVMVAADAHRTNLVKPQYLAVSQH
jgi:hypothetical protein